MDTRTRCMINAKVIQLLITAKQITFLFIDHQFLNKFIFFGDIQMMTGRRFTGPWWNLIMISHRLPNERFIWVNAQISLEKTSSTLFYGMWMKNIENCLPHKKPKYTEFIWYTRWWYGNQSSMVKWVVLTKHIKTYEMSNKRNFDSTITNGSKDIRCGLHASYTIDFCAMIHSRESTKYFFIHRVGLQNAMAFGAIFFLFESFKRKQHRIEFV